MSLYHKYRPTELEDIRGNSDMIPILQEMLNNKEKCSHAFLLHGPTGCGKTTLGRIIAKELKCIGNDFREINSADFRGIDMIREVRKQAQYKPLEGNCRVWLIDECFAKGTLVSMENGLSKPIEDIVIRDKVKNLNGTGKVKHIFKNKVLLNRVLKIKFSNGSAIICSEDHLFLTPQGWVKAKYLKDNFVYLNKFNNFMPGINLQMVGKNEENKTILSTVSKNTKKKSEKILFQAVIQSGECKTGKNRNTNLSYLWEGFCRKMVFYENILQQKVWQYFSRTETNWAYAITGNLPETINKTHTVFTNRKRQINATKAFRTNEEKQSIVQSKKYSEREGNQTNTRNSSCLERGTRRERKINNSSKIISSRFRLGNGSSDQNKSQSIRQIKLSYLLQNGYRKFRLKTINRSRWTRAQIEEEYIFRSKENEKVSRIRVESIEIYKRGNNDRSFKSIIKNTERNQGFVTFYDLEIDNHPSYFVEGIAVHNCHKMTNDAQNALLKLLEDTPSHVYFILGTTEPQRMLATIKGRCAVFQVHPLNERQMFGLLRSVVKEEEESIPREIFEQIHADSFGHPRNALQILEKVLMANPEDRLEVAKQVEAIQSQSIELCRVLVGKGTAWKEVREILNGLKEEEPESIRRHVLGYAQAVLLKSDNERAGLVLEEFVDHFYSSGFPGLVLASYSVIKN